MYADILSIYQYVLICAEYSSTAVAFSQVVRFLRDFRQTKENIVYQGTDLYLYDSRDQLIYANKLI
jgi:hypothetical protein